MMISLQNIIKILFSISRAIEFLASFMDNSDNGYETDEESADQEHHIDKNDSYDSIGSNDGSQQSGQ